MTASSSYSGLIERLEWESGDCPFCGGDPYHYVDNGVGMERVAVTCCDEGIALFQHGDPVLQTQITLRTEAAAALRNLEADNARLEADNARKDAALNAVNEWNMAFDGLPPPTAILVSAALSRSARPPS